MMKKNKRYGVIDMGTNSLRLMIAEEGEGKLNIISKQIITTRLGEGMSKNSAILPSAAQRTADALNEFKKRAAAFEADELFAFATSMVRESANKAEFLKEMKEKTGFDIDVISGSEEAKLGLLGTLNGKDGGIIDIGGGSTEVTFAKNGSVSFTKSFDIGIVRWLNRFTQNGIADYERCERETEEYLSELKSVCPVSPVFGIGGTATSLCCVMLGMSEYDSKLIQGKEMPFETIDELAERLKRLTMEERKALVCFDEKRADIIPFGAIIMREAMRALRLKSIFISDSDNLEGYLLNKLLQNS